MVSLALLPDELLLTILTEAAYLRSIKRALRLRLVCKRFANITTTAIFNSRILDCKEIRGHIYEAPDFWAEYLAYLTLTHAPRKSRELESLLLIAQYICHYRYASTGETCATTGMVTDDEIKECVLDLCKLATCTSSYMTVHWPAASSAEMMESGGDGIEYNFKRLLISAAAWIGEESLVAELLREGCNWFGGPSMFLEPIRAASYRGHVDIAKLIITDDSKRGFRLVSPALIVNYFNDHTDLLDLGLNHLWYGPGDDKELRLLALGSTSNLETFKRLLKDVKPQLARDTSITLIQRFYAVSEKGLTDIMKYLIEEERIDIIEDDADDTSHFKSRYPAEFQKGFMREHRARTPLSLAARRGHGDAVKILLDAGAKQKHSIEFAAMCGSRRIVKLLWEYGGCKDDAVQGALAIALDREDTGMFNFLIKLGAKLDDDVRAAITQKAQEEGLESMVTLLSEDAHLTSKGIYS